MTSFNSQPQGVVIHDHPPFYPQGNWGSEQGRDISEVTQLHVRLQMTPLSLWLQTGTPDGNRIFWTQNFKSPVSNCRHLDRESHSAVPLQLFPRDLSPGIRSVNPRAQERILLSSQVSSGPPGWFTCPPVRSCVSCVPGRRPQHFNWFLLNLFLWVGVFLAVIQYLRVVKDYTD